MARPTRASRAQEAGGGRPAVNCPSWASKARFVATPVRPTGSERGAARNSTNANVTPADFGFGAKMSAD